MFQSCFKFWLWAILFEYICMLGFYLYCRKKMSSYMVVEAVLLVFILYDANNHICKYAFVLI